MPERAGKGAGELLRGVVGVIDAKAAGEVLRGEPLPDGLGGVELRADLLPSLDEAFRVLEKISTELSVLFTLRLEEQGGEYRGDEKERTAVFRKALERGAALIDAEWPSCSARQLAVDDAPLVLSHHDFRGMPSADELARLTAEMESCGPRAIKVVPTATTLGDSARMLEWVAARRTGAAARVGFAMGEKGLPSRVLCIARGAPWTYASVGDAVAPGQPSAGDLTALYRIASLGERTELFGVIGNPVAHSLSPDMHNPALARAGMDAVYLPLRLDSIAELEDCWDALRIRGLSVTIPFKGDAFRRADDADPRARRARAANTLVVHGSGAGGGRPRISAWNTDFEGVLEPLRRRIELDGVRVAVLGNGGAARGAVEALKEAGAAPCLVFRNRDRGRPVADELGVPGFLFADFPAGDVDVVINATSVGLEEGDPSPLPEDTFHSGMIAFDMIYDPAETAFLASARRRGARTIGGGEMLVAQGLAQFRLFTGIDPDREVFEEGFARGRRERPRR